ncbi:hypothetical protein JQN58_39025 [Aneurinibacillus sp. BA2021]|nr:hypothetical protein [Aneurinibacillus sp. BA2021]
MYAAKDKQGGLYAKHYLSAQSNVGSFPLPHPCSFCPPGFRLLPFSIQEQHFSVCTLYPSFFVLTVKKKKAKFPLHTAKNKGKGKILASA